MMSKHKKSFFDRLTGNFSPNDEDEEDIEEMQKIAQKSADKETKESEWFEDEENGQLTIDMFQTPTELVIEAMVAGVKPEDLDISVTQDMITLKGKRQKSKEVSKDNYYYKELYWGSFSRSIMLPQEVDTDNIDATIKSGVLVIRLPKINREKTQKIKIKSE